MASAIADALQARPGGGVVPITLASQTVALLYTDGVPTPMLGVLATYAGRCLEALTAIKAACTLTARAGSNGGAGTTSDRDEATSAARRYAKLLVSEIKLYHEPAVVTGRRERDLTARLGGEIARARVLYEQRVPADVPQRARIFHDELVRTLADGDASLL